MVKVSPEEAPSLTVISETSRSSLANTPVFVPVSSIVTTFSPAEYSATGGSFVSVISSTPVSSFPKLKTVVIVSVIVGGVSAVVCEVSSLAIQGPGII